jgi:YegS/Rv2252/BmrU family lipid kinase
MVLIANRRAGRGSVAKALPEVEDHLRKRHLEYEVRYTEGRGHATEIARESIAAGKRFLVAVGGDGTIHEVVNGMIVDDRTVGDDQPVLGVIGAGTGCDFIRTFGIPGMPGHAVSHLDGPESFPIDLGKVTYSAANGPAIRYFANIAEAGLGAATIARSEKLPRFLGPTLYMFAFWLTLRRHRSYQAQVDLVDRSWEGKLNNLVVANCQFFGGGMKIAPKAAPTDGLLDVLIEHARKREAIALLPKIYKGEHLPHPDFELFKRVKVTVTADRPLPVEADGELLGETPATFEVLKEAILIKV